MPMNSAKVETEFKPLQIGVSAYRVRRPRAGRGGRKRQRVTFASEGGVRVPCPERARSPPSPPPPLRRRSERERGAI